MKKFLSVLFCLVLVLALVGCANKDNKDDGKDKNTETKITVEFNSNGGSQIASKEATVDATGRVDFTLPEAPLKPGFVFDGWYLDEALTQEFDLTKLATLTKVTLYANWKPEEKKELKLDYMPNLDVDPAQGINLEFDLKASAEVDHSKVADVNLNVKIQSEKCLVESVSEFDVEITLVPTITIYAEGKALTKEEMMATEDNTLATIALISGNEFKLIAQDGILYGVIPGSMLGGDASSNMVMKIVLQDVLDALEEKLDELMELLPEEAKDFLPEEEPEVAELTPEQIEELISEAVAKAMAELNKLGISNEFVGDFIALASEFLPTKTENGKVTTYEYTQASFEKALDDLAVFFENHFDEIATAVVNAGIAEAPDENDKEQAIKSVKEAVEEVKQAVNIEALKANCTVDDNDLPTTIDGELRVQVGPEEKVVSINGSFRLDLSETSLNFVELLSLAEEDEFAFSEGVIINVQKVNENKGSFDETVTVQITTKEYDSESDSYVDQVVNAQFQTSFTTELKDNTLTYDFNAGFEVENIAQASVSVQASLTDHGAYQKTAFTGGELATDMTESLVALIEGFDVTSLFGSSDSDLVVE